MQRPSQLARTWNPKIRALQEQINRLLEEVEEELEYLNRYGSEGQYEEFSCLKGLLKGVQKEASQLFELV